MDDTDLRILRVLQADSSLSVTDVAREVGLSASPCWKRINKLRADGVIRQQTAVLDAEQLGFGLTVFMELRTGEHSGDWLRSFAETCPGDARGDGISSHGRRGRLSAEGRGGGYERFDEFYKRLVETTSLAEVTSRFSMESIKQTTALPI